MNSRIKVNVESKLNHKEAFEGVSMSQPINFEELSVGAIFYIEHPYRQYYVKLQEWEANGSRFNCEELETGKAGLRLPEHDSRFPIFADDRGQSWKGQKRPG